MMVNEIYFILKLRDYEFSKIILTYFNAKPNPKIRLY